MLLFKKDSTLREVPRGCCNHWPRTNLGKILGSYLLPASCIMLSLTNWRQDSPTCVNLSIYLDELFFYFAPVKIFWIKQEDIENWSSKGVARKNWLCEISLKAGKSQLFNRYWQIQWDTWLEFWCQYKCMEVLPRGQIFGIFYLMSKCCAVRGLNKVKSNTQSYSKWNIRLSG
jgi:hypothetical protein